MNKNPYIAAIQDQRTKQCLIRIVKNGSYYTIEAGISLSEALEASSLLQMLTGFRVYKFTRDSNLKLKTLDIFKSLGE